jgi:hypothetical protein
MVNPFREDVWIHRVEGHGIHLLPERAPFACDHPFDEVALGTREYVRDVSVGFQCRLQRPFGVFPLPFVNPLKLVNGNPERAAICLHLRVYGIQRFPQQVSALLALLAQAKNQAGGGRGAIDPRSKLHRGLQPPGNPAERGLPIPADLLSDTTNDLLGSIGGVSGRGQCDDHCFVLCLARHFGCPIHRARFSQTAVPKNNEPASGRLEGSGNPGDFVFSVGEVIPPSDQPDVERVLFLWLSD